MTASYLRRLGLFRRSTVSSGTTTGSQADISADGTSMGSASSLETRAEKLLLQKHLERHLKLKVAEAANRGMNRNGREFESTSSSSLEDKAKVMPRIRKAPVQRQQALKSFSLDDGQAAVATRRSSEVAETTSRIESSSTSLSLSEQTGDKSTSSGSKKAELDVDNLCFSDPALSGLVQMTQELMFPNSLSGDEHNRPAYHANPRFHPLFNEHLSAYNKGLAHPQKLLQPLVRSTAYMDMQSLRPLSGGSLDLSKLPPSGERSYADVVSGRSSSTSGGSEQGKSEEPAPSPAAGPGPAAGPAAGPSSPAGPGPVAGPGPAAGSSSPAGLGPTAGPGPAAGSGSAVGPCSAAVLSSASGSGPVDSGISATGTTPSGSLDSSSSTYAGSSSPGLLPAVTQEALKSVVEASAMTKSVSDIPHERMALLSQLAPLPECDSYSEASETEETQPSKDLTAITVPTVNIPSAASGEGEEGHDSANLAQGMLLTPISEHSEGSSLSDFSDYVVDSGPESIYHIRKYHKRRRASPGSRLSDGKRMRVAAGIDRKHGRGSKPVDIPALATRAVPNPPHNTPDSARLLDDMPVFMLEAAQSPPPSHPTRSVPELSPTHQVRPKIPPSPRHHVCCPRSTFFPEHLYYF